MKRENLLIEYLPQFNATDPSFKDLFVDPSRPEFNPITNINDINKGAIFNALEWHLRYQELAANSSTLSNAQSTFLKDWADLLGIARPASLSDEEFIGYIIGYVLSNQSTTPKISEIFPSPDFFVLRSDEFGFASDVSALDLEIARPGPGTKGVSAILVPDRGFTLVLTSDPTKISGLLFIKLNRIKVAGTIVYFGIFITS
ncbi:hypothetical protein [Leptospira licerasiae]|uniref:Phage tail protein n=1 Tax=Leptospira licerasiae str. MMD4847 TaxID=1049971 RepID=A0ABN0H9H5_9LEPT|nr:hypothetical protein [Leptospira licerasiae]EIE01436.1 hypothetical protein LEP1GSC185_3926 [Leptospira licerasiae serovar Varillal str. VAR 010]EJZ42255.1 hypothetical protein LEP1GSC178_0089 [Leptospira licerasiae str. MMD4847]